ncbi:MAG: V-type ATP synthase subunit F [Oscillospiraceae bacterium]|nr:V-type ATP synthase subunit F [Oscillospiraceae bacterium]
MKFYVISDNADTAVGMRLAGIPGEVVHEEPEVRKALQRCIDDDEVGVVLITEHLVDLCPDTVYDLKLNARRPLIVEIPDRHGGGRTKDSITRYIRESIGLKV